MSIQSVTATISDGAVYETVTISFGTSSANITMGEATITGGADSGNGNLLIAQQATLIQDATLQNLSFYVTAAAGKLRLGLYDSTGPSRTPGKLLAATPEITPVVGWNTIPVPATPLLAGVYWLSYFASSNGLAFRNQQSGAAQWRALTYGPLPTIFSASPLSTQATHWSFYATLATAVAVIPPPVFAGPFNVAPIPPPPPPSSVADLIRSKTSHTTGSWYFEMRVLVSTKPAQIGVGIDNNAEKLIVSGGQVGAVCWLGDGNITYNGTPAAYQAFPFLVGNILGVDINLTLGTIRFRVNGGPFSDAFSISAITGNPMFAFAQLKNPGDQIQANFTGPFAFSAPSPAWG